VKLQSILVVQALLCLGAGWSRAQQAAPAKADSGAIIRTETKLVLVDVVATDKKGAYIHDLTAKDFRVWEDNKEQAIKNFSFEADPASPSNSQPRYLVLFFDNATVNFGDQALARKAAAEFIEKNAGPNRLMAIVNYTGSIQVAQNFTSDVERLKAIASGIKFSSVSPERDAGLRSPRLARAAADFGVRDVILGLRSLAKNLASIEGRKTLIFFTGGFEVSPEELSEVTATIDACNKANVAIYPIDVRGLVAGGPSGQLLVAPPSLRVPGIAAFLRPAAFIPGAAFFAGGQARGGGAPPPGGGGGGGGRAGGGGGAPISGGGGGGVVSPGGGGGRPFPGGGGGPSRIGSGFPTRGNLPATLPPGMIRTPMGLPPGLGDRSRSLIPKFPDNIAKNQEVLHMLADGTGGFVIANTNDLVSGLDKIGRELNEYYLLGYTPPDSDEGSCHTLRVKVDRGGINTRARTGYCNVRSRDMLAQKPAEKQLEARAAAQQPGDIAASLQLPFFFPSPNVARVNVAMEIPAQAFKFEKDKGKLHSELDILGIAYREDQSVGARFSDKVKLDFDSKAEVDAFNKKPFHYENQFETVPGRYTFKVVFSSASESFGKIEKPLAIDGYDGTAFKLSSIAFSTNYRPAASLGTDLDAALIEDRTPLVTEGVQLTPRGSTDFKTTDKPAIYMEVYEPLLASAETPKGLAIAMQLRVLDTKTGDAKVDTGLYRIPVPEKGGNPMIPTGAQLPLDKLQPGTYRLVMSAVDSAGKVSQRWADFNVE
jgi:VWFA-related protein